MKVLHIAHSRFESNAYSYLLSELNHMIEQHCIVPWPVHVNFTKKLPQESSIVKCQFNMLFGQYKLRNWLVDVGVQKFIKKRKLDFDLIHGHYVYTDGHNAYNLHKKHNVPYIVSFRRSDLHIFQKRPHLRNIGIKVLQKASKVIFISQAHYNYFFSSCDFINEYPEIKQKSVVIPNGIDDFWFENMYADRSKQLKETINVITVGWIQKNKNQLHVAEAIAQLRNTHKLNIQYTIIGNIREQGYADELKKYDFIKYLPYKKKEELIHDYREADLFIMPSYTETFGIVYIEALTQHLPVMFTRNQAIDGFFPTHNCVKSVDPNSVSEISSGIKEFIDNYPQIQFPDLATLDKFRWKDIAKQYAQIYNETLSK